MLQLWRWFTAPFASQGLISVLIGIFVFGQMAVGFEVSADILLSGPNFTEHFAPLNLRIAARNGDIWDGLSLFSLQCSCQHSLHGGFYIAGTYHSFSISSQLHELRLGYNMPQAINAFVLPPFNLNFTSGLWLSFMSFLVVRSERSQQVSLCEASNADWLGRTSMESITAGLQSSTHVAGLFF